MLSRDLVTGLCSLGLPILDVVGFVKDYAEEIEREDPTMGSSTAAVTGSDLTKLG